MLHYLIHPVCSRNLPSVVCNGILKLAAVMAIGPFFLMQCTGSGSVYVPGKAIITCGIPPVPAARYRELNRLLDLRFASLVDWTDSGIIILRRTGETAQLHLVRSAGSTPEPLTGSTESVLQAWVSPCG
ncbi:MAG: hypothetical protein JW863_11910 [Chitinispirillaceae bacterium]|nr:hypothetical protein [Chitinispirillaceae bacterium]